MSTIPKYLPQEGGSLASTHKVRIQKIRPTDTSMTLGSSSIKRTRRPFKRGISMSKRIYKHCLKNPREQSSHWGWEGGKRKILKGQKTVTRPQGIQQRLVSSILSELRCIRFVNTMCKISLTE